MIQKKIEIILNLILQYFVRFNFNNKKTKFRDIHKNEFAYFFNDTISKEIDIDGVYEKEEISIISNIVNRNSTIIDIGANIGNHSLAFSKFSKKIYSFEAHPKTFQVLKFNCSNIKKIKLYNIGISDKSGVLYFKNTKTDNIGGRKLSQFGNIKSKINKLDDIINPKKKIDLIKLDVEGHEYQALIGMKKIIKNNKSFLFIEFCENNFAKRKKIIKLLENYGYTKAYFFKKKSEIFKKNYINLIINILSIILNISSLRTRLIKINPHDLIYNGLNSNIIFSKKEINLSKINN